MRIIKQYGHIFFLIIGLAVMCLIGLYLYNFISANQPNKNAQSAPNQPSSESSDNPPLVSVTRVVGKAVVSYYSNSDESAAETENFTAYNDGSDQITLQARIDSTGRTIQIPKTIFLRIVTTSKSNKYISNKAFKIFADEQLLFNKIGSLETSDKDKDKVVTVSLSQEIPYDLFVKMTEAQKVKMQIGPTTFDLKESDVEVFRDLIKTTVP